MLMHLIIIRRHLMQAFHNADDATCPFGIEDASEDSP